MNADDALVADLRREAARLVRLPALGGPRGRLARHPPRILVRRAVRERLLWGFADYDRNEVVIVRYWTSTRADMRATLLHELLHLAGQTRHDAKFKHRLVAAASEAYDVELGAYERGRYAQLDDALERALFWVGVKAWVATAWSRLPEWLLGASMVGNRRRVNAISW